MNTITRYLLAGAGLIIIWKLLALAISSGVLPPPETAFLAFGRELKTSAFWLHFGASAYRVGMSMFLAWLIGFPIGIMIGRNRSADRIVSPFIFLTYPIPKIVLLPVFLIIFGLGDLSKIVMIGLIIGFQVVVATRDGVINLDKKYIDAFRSIGGSPHQTIRHVVLPAALPHAFTALRIGTGTGIAVLFFVETFATERGLGYMIMDSWGRAAFDRMFAGIIGMSLLGVLLHETVNYLEKSLCYWKFLEAGRSVIRSDQNLFSQICTFGRMVKFSHTIFALPFALVAIILAYETRSVTFTYGFLFWILAAMFGARSAGMGFNRIVDARFDAANPRTANRHIPKGVLSMRSALAIVIVCSALFVFSAAMISPTCFYLSFPVLAILLFYSYTKRFTSLSHLFLGFGHSMVPLGAWVAVTGGLDWPIFALSMALMTYIAGFDILYACQDLDFDRSFGLRSIPAKLGPSGAFHVSSVLHILTIFFLFWVFILFDLGAVYLFTIIVIGILLIIEHKIISPNSLERINIAFFHINSIISVVFFLGVLGDGLLRKAL